MSKKPKISFVSPSYNHEKFCSQQIESVLNQTVSNWELIIIDDNSTDKNVEQIKKYDDERIKLIQNSYNRGIQYGLNIGIEKSDSELISFIATDDILVPTYIETVLKIFEDIEIGAIYSPLEIIDENSKSLNREVKLYSEFSQEKIFQKQFLGKNYLPSVAMAFRKSAVSPYFPFDEGLFQVHDWQLHFFILHNTKAIFLKYPISKYRITSGSACERRYDVLFREEIETKKLMDTVIDLIGEDPDSFNKYFGDCKEIKNKTIDRRTIPFWLGKLALSSSVPDKQKWGYQTIMNFISKRENMELLHFLYDFDFREYMRLCPKSNKVMTLDSKLKKYRKRVKILILIIVFLIIFILILIGA